MLFRITLLLALVAFIGFQGAHSKITCSGTTANPAGLAGKFASCLALVSNKGKACRCIADKAGGVPFKVDTAVNYLKSVVPPKDKGLVDPALAPCLPKAKAMKSAKDDPDGTTCLPIEPCVMNLFDKLCK